MLYTFAPSNSCFPTNLNKILHSDLHHHHHHHHHHLHRHFPFPLSSSSSHITTEIVYSLSAIDNKEQNNNQNHRNLHHIEDDDDDADFFNRFYESSPIYLNDRRRKNNDRRQQIIGDEIKESLNIDKVGSSSISRVNLANMWWTDIKAALGQRINVEGLLFSVSVITRHKNWVIPHVSVADIRYIDWAALRRKGFEGVVFDKDNTLTVPYSLALWGPIASSVESCKSVFGNNIAVFSNSAGLEEYDPDGRKARALEYVIGIRVIRHKVKKPAGSAEEIERHFGCDSSKLIMVGDRPFTDIVYGNRNGFLTILTAPLSLAEEPFIVKQVRKIELALVNRWSKKGLKPANERLLSDVSDCVKELPPV